ncbi:hypothetical protein HMPREF1548_01513 [Clostridium sp. KLE 1755]|nr:hypothetical protein HMPREF1548_01513 [Clostridium sp. KLE 1755]
MGKKQVFRLKRLILYTKNGGYSAVFCCVNDICRSGGGFYWIIILLINYFLL